MLDLQERPSHQVLLNKPFPQFWLQGETPVTHVAQVTLTWGGTLLLDLLFKSTSVAAVKSHCQLHYHHYYCCYYY